MRKLRERLPLRTSDIRPLLPMQASRSRGVKPFCSMQNLIASIGLAGSMGWCRLSYTSMSVVRISFSSYSGLFGLAWKIRSSR